jgi:Spy/CpxP family protein refolding chaperone
MKKIIGIAAAALLVAAGVATLTGFHGGCGGHRHGRDPAEVAAFVTNRVEDALDDLDATPEQRTRILAVKDRLLSAAQEARGDRREVHDTILGAWKSDSPDAASLHALVDARAQRLQALAHQGVDAGIEVHSILTPEQREKLTRKIERWHR